MNRSEAYQFTVTDKKDPRVLKIKEHVAFANKLSREETRNGYQRNVNPIWRVRFMPRGPRVEAAWDDFRSRRAYDSYLPQRHANRFDVYIHRDRTAEWMMQRELDTGLTPGQLRSIDKANDAIRLAEFEEMKKLQEAGLYKVHTVDGVQWQTREMRIEELRDRGVSETTIARMYG